MSKLHDLFAKVLHEVDMTLDETEDMSHPLVVLFRTSLQEEKEALERLLPILKGDKPELPEFKKDCSIVYLNDEIVESTFRAWLRAVDWMDHEDSEEAAKLENRFPGIKDTLKKAAAEIEKTYGDESSKYVVPALYRPQTGGVR
ncbi:hypothetical protein [Saccharibacillus kuerlensis]|uniref:Uncharacterized protein n=1 Tax=Saccharibacillus kuerlensis TaxID=459527 RepID=A0ABQ2L3Z9_9BACL|nr:hypothetical protein [Saccharibacillus kuerlensis]GGO01696.1 hypothetical protein GCM10010969_24320 [Saccharibacillus kuerlensis]